MLILELSGRVELLCEKQRAPRRAASLPSLGLTKRGVKSTGPQAPDNHSSARRWDLRLDNTEPQSYKRQSVRARTTHPMPRNCRK
jgi:hypothetical protein